MTIARSACAGMAADAGIGLFQCIDEIECGRRGSLVEKVGGRVTDISDGMLARNYKLDLHPREADVGALHSRSRGPST
jgi:hypothetical protein